MGEKAFSLLRQEGGLEETSRRLNRMNKSRSVAVLRDTSKMQNHVASRRRAMHFVKSENMVSDFSIFKTKIFQKKI